MFKSFLFISDNSEGWIATHIIHFFDTSVDTGLPAASSERKINENDIQKYFGSIEQMLETKFSMLEKRIIPDQGVPGAECKMETYMQKYFGYFEKKLETKLSMLGKRLTPDERFLAAECKINENNMQNYFGNIEQMLETKFSILEKRSIPDQIFPVAECKIDDNYMCICKIILE